MVSGRGVWHGSAGLSSGEGDFDVQAANARLRRAVNARGHFPTEQAALKCLYLAIMSLDPTGKGANAGPTAGRPR